MSTGLTASQKAILVLENKRLFLTARGALNKHNIEIENGFLSLHSLPLIKKILARTGSTAFIRAELVRFLKEAGMPYVFILDYDIDLGGSDSPETDRKRLLRTYMVAYIILSRGQGMEGLTGNFILAAPPARMKELQAIEKNPHAVLSMLTTKDATVNSFIDDLKRDEAGFNRLFYIKGLNSEAGAGEITALLEKFLADIRQRFARP